MESNRHFTAIVVGENPDEIMEKYDLSKKVEPYVVYRLSDISKYKENALKAYQHIANSEIMPESIREEYKEKVLELEKMDDIDFYSQLTEDFELDDETGDAMCDVNPDGHYNVCRLGKNLAMPLIDKKDQEVFQARKNELDYYTIDKLCRINDSFKDFITKTTNVLNAQASLVDDVKNGLQRFCDSGFDNEDVILTYCRENHIPC